MRIDGTRNRRFARTLTLLISPILVLIAAAPAQPVHANNFTGGCTPLPYVALQGTPATVNAGDPVMCSANWSSNYTWSPPADGTDCSHWEQVPATVTPATGNGPFTITWTDLLGNNRSRSGVSQTDMQNWFGSNWPLPGGQLLYLEYPLQGTWQGGVCQQHKVTFAPCSNGNFQQVNQLPTGFGTCLWNNPPPQGGSAAATGAIITNLLQTLKRQYTLNIVGSLPDQGAGHPGLVGLPSCFWLAQAPPPLTQTLQLVVVGTDQVIYTLRITLNYNGVDWNFGDPNDPSSTEPSTPNACGTQPGLTAHDYKTYSGAASAFNVTATINFTVDATEYWYNGFTGVAQQVLAGAPLQVLSNTYPYTVIQEEGVPVG